MAERGETVDCAHEHPVRRLNGEPMPCPSCGYLPEPSKPALDLARPMQIRAEMARAAIAPMHVFPYDDPERGWVDPLDDDETRTVLRRFLGALWRACERAEAEHSGSNGEQS